MTCILMMHDLPLKEDVSMLNDVSMSFMSICRYMSRRLVLYSFNIFCHNPAQFNFSIYIQLWQETKSFLQFTLLYLFLKHVACSFYR